ncbi:Metallo-beta-lactamase superfamily protein [Mycena sanguinolenta]|uniref:Metallo-beta-lactamase superfamily protein n=1 Tax=Mycena sanguinolenta TaxID=230812 RepID=A0A8H7D0W9_9AGAR|nr:Metallo-beta-lactamase superfamily protein [Mycena sanguinolenta]
MALSKLLLFGALLASQAGNTYASYRDFGIPASSATVDVRVFNVANMTLIDETHAFITPVVPGHESVSFPMYSFIIEHNNTRLMFDLGIRKDPQNTPPSISVAFEAGAATLEPYKDITVLLQEGGINLTSIDAVIWSHAHFDHVGDMSTFPNSTNIIIGPATDTSIYPANPNATLQASDFAGHNVIKIDFASSNLTFAGMKAVDHFGDGSLYLLDTPGHLPGHITGLARVTPTSFLVLAYPCPAHLLEESKSAVSTDYFWSHDSAPGAFDLPSRAAQLLALSDLPDSFYADPVTAAVSLEKVATFDADDDFFIITAHDISLRSSIPYFPAYINGWQQSGLKQQAVWNFIDQTNPAFVFSPINATQ